MARKKKHKTKRKQPTPKHKKQPFRTAKSSVQKYKSEMKKFGRAMLEMCKDKEQIKAIITKRVADVEAIFKKYDSIQLLGGVGLYLMDNLPNIEKSFMAQMAGKKLDLDEKAEVIAEYAMNFGLSMPNDGLDTPTDEVIEKLKYNLCALTDAYSMLDMPLDNNPEEFINWLTHVETISVRGDGYQVHVQQVFQEMFYPHSEFYKNKYGFTIEELYHFFKSLEDRIICKIGSQNMIYGCYKMHERWKKWEEDNYGAPNKEVLLKRDFSKGLFGDFFEANPDVPTTEDGQFVRCYEPDDFRGSEKIFWVYPQNEIEKIILNTLSAEFGSNAEFIAEGDFKGNIMNGHSIFEKPFVKVGDRYYCFTPMIPYRNQFLIAEKLMMQDNRYYNEYFQQNTSPISRDQFIERKVREVFESFLPHVKFLSSVHYKIVEDGEEKKPELDIVGVSDKAAYIIEVKAHELSHKDRVGLIGMKTKFHSSVWKGCDQCCRVMRYIESVERPIFATKECSATIDKTKPIYKITVTFQHYSALIGHMDHLINAGMMEERFRDIWIVSLFDLMVVADFIESEEQFIKYLDVHMQIYQNHGTFKDELDVFSHYLNHNLENKIRSGASIMIIDGSEDIDEEYAKDYQLPLNEGNMNEHFLN